MIALLLLLLLLLIFRILLLLPLLLLLLLLLLLPLTVPDPSRLSTISKMALSCSQKCSSCPSNKQALFLSLVVALSS